MEKDVSFLEEKVRGVLEPMINGVFKEAPEDPVKYMIQWLNRYIGINESNMEKDELNNLRKEFAKYQKKYEKEDKEMELHSDEEEDDHEAQDEFDKEIEEKQKKIAKEKVSAQRISICSEVYGDHHKKVDYVPRVVPKTEGQKEIIKNKMLENFMFSNLDENELITVINAFEEKHFAAGETVITQGDYGDVVYLIESGELSCSKKNNNGEEIQLKTYKSGESFGELALLYNAPRAATIVAKTESVLWSLDRKCFNSIVKGAAIKKRERYESVLKSVEILQTIDSYELSQICDALKVEKVKQGTRIITQNEEGNKFYILEDGEAFASKVIEGKEEIVLEYKKGMYFGELALLKNEPRAANVDAKTDCVLLTLDRMAFKRLLGPLETLLKRNSEAYVKYVNTK